MVALTVPGRIDGVMAASYLFNNARITQVLQCSKAMVDPGRLKSLKPVPHFLYMDAMRQPPILSLDYEHSLRAAFLRDVFENLARAYLVPEVGVFTTFKIPVLHIVKTPDRGLSAETRARFREMRQALPRKYRGDLDDIRLFTRLGGLKNDPFAG